MLYLGQNTERNKLFVSNFLEQNNGLITNNNRNRKIVKLNQKFCTANKLEQITKTNKVIIRIRIPEIIRKSIKYD